MKFNNGISNVALYTNILITAIHIIKYLYTFYQKADNLLCACITLMVCQFGNTIVAWSGMLYTLNMKQVTLEVQ